MADGGSCAPDRPPDGGPERERLTNGAAGDACAAGEGGVLARPEALPVAGLMRIAAAAAGAKGAFLCVAGTAARWAADGELAATRCPCARGSSPGEEPGRGAAAACRASGNEGGPALTLPARDGRPGVTLCLDGPAPDPVARRTLDAVAHEVAAVIDLLVAFDRTEALRSETDHRVKNALQSVASFLRLQEGRTPDPGARRVLAAAGRHVSSIALLHQEVTLGTEPALVELERYLRGLGRLFRSVAPEQIRVEVDVSGGALPFDRAAALAAIANEFVSNAFKHAFPDGGPGTIRIDGRLGDDGLMRITMRDDGAGGAPGTAGTGLGMRIVKAAAAKLGASLTSGAHAPRGFRLDLVFPAHAGGEVPAVAADRAA